MYAENDSFLSYSMSLTGPSATRILPVFMFIQHFNIQIINWWAPNTKAKKNLPRFVVIADKILCSICGAVLLPDSQGGKLLFAAWKETGCAYLWMKGLARTLHPSKDHDPIWLPGHMVLFLRQRESQANSPPQLDWIKWQMKRGRVCKNHECVAPSLMEICRNGSRTSSPSHSHI